MGEILFKLNSCEKLLKNLAKAKTLKIEVLSCIPKAIIFIYCGPSHRICLCDFLKG